MPASTISSSSRAALAGGKSPASLPEAIFSFMRRARWNVSRCPSTTFFHAGVGLSSQETW